MAATKYTYSVANDTANGKAAGSSLTGEITASSIVTALDHVEITGDVLDIWFKDALSAGDQTILTSIVGAHAGTVASVSEFVKDQDGDIKVTVVPRLGNDRTIISHNFCDRCSWYPDSIEVIDEVATVKVPGNYDVYELAHDYVIDTEHGRITLEDNLDSKYRVGVKVNDVLQESGWNMDYPLGEVTFTPALTVSDIVKVSYYYESGSAYYVAPKPGEKLKIVTVEVQFSEDIHMSSKIHMDTWVYNPADLPNKILYDRVTYKNIKDFINKANLGTGKIDAIDELSSAVRVFPWNWQTVKYMKDSEGAELRISLSDHVPLEKVGGGVCELATVTFYCIVEEED